MQRFFSLRRFHRLGVPGAMLLALLQRTPVARVAAAGEAALVRSPVGSMLRSAFAAAASLGTIQSLAGATQFVASPGVSDGITVTAGTAVNVAYTVTGTTTPPDSWSITGDIPPGLDFSGLTQPGVVTVETLTLTGTPTVAGTYEVGIQAFEGPNATLTATPIYPYTITVNPSSGATTPTITTQPQSQSANVGAAVTFTVAATGSPAPSYQWRRNGVNVIGANNASLTLNPVQHSDAGVYTVVAGNSAGSVTSAGATLTVNNAPGPLPVFGLQPASQSIAAGSTVVFNVAATGATAFQWRRNGVDIVGATGPTLLIRGATAADAGTYAALAGNSSGTTTSSGATLTVTTVVPADMGRLTNLSVRTHSGAGDRVLNVGFAVGGDGTVGTQPLLVRVTGPAIAAFGVAGAMADPTLVVKPFGSTTVVASNDDWAGDATVAATTSAVGAFPLANPASQDAAVVASLTGGTYTAIAGGKNDTTGIVLTEMYDATPRNSITAATPRLVNVSARANAGSGDGILIAGFVVAGSTAKTLLIRATGPRLADFGVTETLADPKLELYVLGGPKLYENDNWGGSTAATTVSDSVGAFPIVDPTSKDAVLVVTLPPGGYTANVSGADGGTGIALIEIYDVK